MPRRVASSVRLTRRASSCPLLTRRSISSEGPPIHRQSSSQSRDSSHERSAGKRMSGPGARHDRQSRCRGSRATTTGSRNSRRAHPIETAAQPIGPQCLSLRGHHDRCVCVEERWYRRGDRQAARSALSDPCHISVGTDQPGLAIPPAGLRRTTTTTKHREEVRDDLRTPSGQISSDARTAAHLVTAGHPLGTRSRR